MSLQWGKQQLFWLSLCSKSAPSVVAQNNNNLCSSRTCGLCGLRWGRLVFAESPPTRVGPQLDFPPPGWLPHVTGELLLAVGWELSGAEGQGRGSFLCRSLFMGTSTGCFGFLTAWRLSYKSWCPREPGKASSPWVTLPLQCHFCHI